MRFDSAFDIGQKVWVATPDAGPVELTVGKVIVEYTDSPGIPGEGLFDNYKPQDGYTEKYMCVETGIGSGSLWELGKNIFANMDDCQAAIDKS